MYKAFENSFLKHQNDKKITATARAGNVVGGGDWSPHRVIPDAYKAMKSRTPLKLRNPYHTMASWQHVLEPLSGYLCLAAIMHHKPDLNGNNFNFGPSQNMNESVGDLVNSLRKHWPDLEISEEKAQIKFEEAPLLQLSSELGEQIIKVEINLNFDETITSRLNGIHIIPNQQIAKTYLILVKTKFNYLQKLQNKEGSLASIKLGLATFTKLKKIQTEGGEVLKGINFIKNLK